MKRKLLEVNRRCDDLATLVDAMRSSVDEVATMLLAKLRTGASIEDLVTGIRSDLRQPDSLKLFLTGDCDLPVMDWSGDRLLYPMENVPGPSDSFPGLQAQHKHSDAVPQAGSFSVRPEPASIYHGATGPVNVVADSCQPSEPFSLQSMGSPRLTPRSSIPNSSMTKEPFTPGATFTHDQAA